MTGTTKGPKLKRPKAKFKQGLPLSLATRRLFPDPLEAPSDGLVAVGDDLEVATLVEAYSFGIFPWPQDEELPVLWFCPRDRGLLEFKDFHISKRLKRDLKSADFEFSINQAFDQVIDVCSSIPRKGEDGTWITEAMIEAYKQFHRAGYAHSVECWQKGVLVGGLYGVYVAGVFSGESMFHNVSHASKAALIHLVGQLRDRGFNWMDIQMVTPLMESFGGKTLPRKAYLKKLNQAKLKAVGLDFPVNISG